jgi:1-deoxy-D-xylulose-5-phosphate reductoisomerase
VAVAAFLDRQIRFDQIHAVNEATLASVSPGRADTLDDLLGLDAQARRVGSALVRKLGHV